MLPDMRLKINERLQLTVLGRREVNISGRLVGASDCGLEILVEQPVAPGQPLKVELAGYVLLGETAASMPAGNAYRMLLTVRRCMDTRTLAPWWESLRRHGEPVGAGVEGCQNRRL